MFLAAIAGIYFIPYASWLSVMLVLMFTLFYGERDGVLALVVLLLAAFIQAYWLYHHLIWFVPLNITVLWLSACILRRYSSWSDVFNLAVAYSLVVIPLIYFVNPDIQVMWVAFWRWLVNLAGAYFQQLNQLSVSTLGVSFQSDWSDFMFYLTSSRMTSVFLPKMSTGILLSLYLLGNLSLLAMARAWYLRYKPADSPAVEIRQIRLHISATLALLLLLVSQRFELVYRLDMLCVLSVLFFLAGLSLAHELAHRLKNPWLGLTLIYVLLSFLPEATVIFLIVLAALDSIIDVRKRLDFFQNSLL